MKAPGEIKEIVSNYFSADQDLAGVYLFGSYADGTQNGASDIDLGMLYKRGLSEREYVNKYRGIGGILR